MSRASIVVHDGDAPLPILPEDVYFTFASGIYDYDCPSCGEKCCRGFGYATQTGSELDYQLATSPSLRFFVNRRSSEAQYVEIHNCPPGCFFLTDAGRCGIEQADGHDSKPETCRLFPFNNLLRVGRYLVVRPHSGLCPLSIVSPSYVSAASSYDLLVTEMAIHGIAVPIPCATPIERDVAALIELEREVVRSSARFLVAPDFGKFATEQLSATHRVFGRGRADGEGASEDLRRYRAVLRRVLGLDGMEGSVACSQMDRVMTAATPYLRSLATFPMKREGDERGDGLSVERIPRILIAVHTLVALAVAAGMTEVTFQSVSAIYQKQRHLIALLALLDAEVEWRSSAPAPLVFPGDESSRGRYLRVLQSVLDGSRRRRRRVPLGTILCENLPDDGVERVVFLRNLAALVSGRLGVVNEGPEWQQRPRQSIRAGILHFTIPRVDHDLLMAIAEQVRSRQVQKGRVKGV